MNLTNVDTVYYNTIRNNTTTATNMFIYQPPDGLVIGRNPVYSERTACTAEAYIFKLCKLTNIAPKQAP